MKKVLNTKDLLEECAKKALNYGWGGDYNQCEYILFDDGDLSLVCIDIGLRFTQENISICQVNIAGIHNALDDSIYEDKINSLGDLAYELDDDEALDALLKYHNMSWEEYLDFFIGEWVKIYEEKIDRLEIEDFIIEHDLDYIIK